MIQPEIKLYPKWYMKFQKLVGTKFRGTTLYPIGIFVDKFDYYDWDKFINHENIHWHQQVECKDLFNEKFINVGDWGVIYFYWLYITEWIGNVFKYKKKAYKYLSMEQEAYLFDQDIVYLRTRDPFQWKKYKKFKPIK